LAMIHLGRFQLAESRPWIMGYSFVSPPCHPGAARFSDLGDSPDRTEPGGRVTSNGQALDLGDSSERAKNVVEVRLSLHDQLGDRRTP
jgi:hypothetical protein